MIFVLDTNVLWKIQKLIRLARAARLHGHSIEVPALAHAERLAQVRREHQQPGKTFDPAIVEAFLLTHGLQVVPFDKSVAQRSAEALAARYPEKERWHEARRDQAYSGTRHQQKQTRHGQTSAHRYIARHYNRAGHRSAWLWCRRRRRRRRCIFIV